MSATEAIKLAQNHGVNIAVKGGNLLLDADKPPPPTVVEALRENKTEILDFLIGPTVHWDKAEWVAFYDERAAIAEHDGGLGKAQAYEACIIQWLTLNPVPATSPDVCAQCLSPETEGMALIPVLNGAGGHIWLHSQCHPRWMANRRNQARRALKRISLPASGSVDCALNTHGDEK